MKTDGDASRLISALGIGFRAPGQFVVYNGSSGKWVVKGGLFVLCPDSLGICPAESKAFDRGAKSLHSVS